jgi:hypothetical protein
LTGNEEDALATVHVTYSLSEADVLCGMLNAYGIPAFIPTRELAANGLIIATGGLEIRVPARCKRDALALLADVVKDGSPP